MRGGSDWDVVKACLAGFVYAKQAASPRGMCVSSYENNSDCCQRPSKSKPGACRAEQRVAGQSGHRARTGLAGRRGKLAQGPTEHNGLFGKVAAVTALKLRLVRLPLARPSGLPNPRYVLRPLPCAHGQRSRGVAPAVRLQSSGQCGIGCAETAGCSSQALRAVRGVGPRPPVVGQALCAFGPAPGGGPSAPRGGSLHPGAGCCGGTSRKPEPQAHARR